MKDISPDWEESRRRGVSLRSPEGYAEMGQGVIDFRRMLPILDRANFRGWLMAETLTPLKLLRSGCMKLSSAPLHQFHLRAARTK